MRADCANLPFRFGIPDEAIGSLVKDKVGDGHFAGDICGIRTIVAEDEYAVGVSCVDEIRR